MTTTITGVRAIDLLHITVDAIDATRQAHREVTFDGRFNVSAAVAIRRAETELLCLHALFVRAVEREEEEAARALKMSLDTPEQLS